MAVQPSQKAGRSARFKSEGRKLVSTGPAAVGAAGAGATTTTTTTMVAGGAAGQGNDSPRVQRSPRVQTMEEMDRRIEEDALALINMKREILESQKAEVGRAQQKLAVIRKEHDTLHMGNERLQLQIGQILDRANTLEVVDRGVKAAGNATQELVNNFNKQLAEAEEIQAAEMRSLRMQQHMLSRLDAEIAEMRALSAKATFKLDTLRHEIVATENTLILSKVERGAQEHKLNDMKKTLEGLTKERNNKLGMMNSIIEDGEMSLSRVQGSVFDASFKSPRSRGSTTSRLTTRESPTRTAEDLEDFDLATVEGKPEVLAKRLSVAKVREMVDRYNTRDSRMEKLEKLESDLRERVVFERARQTELQESIDDLRAKHHTIASSRTKMYKDMDDMANAHWRAKKACDEANDKDQRLKSNIESIKRAIPRFLSKLTKSFVPVPSVEDVRFSPTFFLFSFLSPIVFPYPLSRISNPPIPHPTPPHHCLDPQLPDVIQKLEDEILRVFKATSAAVQKDTPAEEMAAIPQGQAGSGSGVQGSTESEITRLQKLPGFSQLQRTLFFNMMAAKPDNSSNNVRVQPAQTLKGRRGAEGGEALPGFAKSSVGHLQISMMSRATGATEYVGGAGSLTLAGDGDDEGEGEAFIPQGLSDLHGRDEPSLEGDLVKRISNLVIERDGGGWGKVLERRAEEARREHMREERKRNAKTKRKIGVW